ncbi:hypothetical protein REL12_018460 [Clostridioides difficile]|uniref:hypothetical protein n=1 Tax=Clostridioides difficile TaxID=1496 RepID=UPI00093FFA09|nr:hypothetical protein [Clostridioides difficile]EGT3800925.1 hypothetical protein [Clostridioides difficile]MBH6911478.1 hypothetical protein [Clostridioides difficile]MBH7984288.1 hypothetical protein [Clostridioides difficile]MBJ8621390.1 hypothetical protein [Clostridioides difficile]MBY1263754.1 hypothetical protein [Clostridioides difficile]
MWQRFKKLNLFLKIIIGFIVLLFFPVFLILLIAEFTVKSFKNKKIVRGLIGIFIIFIFAGEVKVYLAQAWGINIGSQVRVSNESEVNRNNELESKQDDKKVVNMSEDEQKISKVTNLAPEQVQNIAKILKECGIEEFESIKHDEGLDNAHFDGEKGYRIEFGGSKNIILYMNKDNSVYNVRWADNDFYKDGKVVSKVSDYTLTMDEKTALQLQCQNGVSAILKSPSTAKFPNITKWMFSKNKEEIVVQSYVDSQNSFGATMRSEFQIIFTSDGKDVKSFIFDGKEMIK